MAWAKIGNIKGPKGDPGPSSGGGRQADPPLGALMMVPHHIAMHKLPQGWSRCFGQTVPAAQKELVEALGGTVEVVAGPILRTYTNDAAWRTKEAALHPAPKVGDTVSVTLLGSTRQFVYLGGDVTATTSWSLPRAAVAATIPNLTVTSAQPILGFEYIMYTGVGQI